MPSALASLTHKAALAGALVLLVAYTVGVVYVTDWVRPEPEPPPAPEPDTVRVEAIERDTLTQLVSRVVRVAETTHVTERDTIRIEVPTKDTVIADTTAQVPWRPYGLIDETPVTRDGRDFTLTYYKLSDQRWEQRVYSAPRPDPVWALGPYATARALPSTLTAEAGLAGEYKSLRATLGYAQGRQRGLTVGLTVQHLWRW